MGILLIKKKNRLTKMTTTATTNVFIAADASTTSCPGLTLEMGAEDLTSSTDTTLTGYTDGYFAKFSMDWSGNYVGVFVTAGDADTADTSMLGAVVCGTKATATVFPSGAYMITSGIDVTAVSGGSNTYASVAPSLSYLAAATGELGVSFAALSGDEYGITFTPAAGAITSTTTFTSTFQFNMPTRDDSVTTDVPSGKKSGDRWDAGTNGESVSCYGGVSTDGTAIGAISTACGAAKTLVLGAQAGLAFGAAALASALAF